MPTAQAAHRVSAQQAPKAPGLLMGVGFGGFVDGIVLHQIVQWHHMISSTSGNSPRSLVGLETNTVADGFFHLSTWIFVLLGVTLTVRAWQSGKLAPPWRSHRHAAYGLGHLQPRGRRHRPPDSRRPSRP